MGLRCDCGNNWEIRSPLVDKNNCLGVHVVQGLQSAAFGNNECTVPEITRVCAGSACFRVFFSTVVYEMDKHSQAVHTPKGRVGFGQHS